MWNQIGIILIIAGVVMGMGAAWMAMMLSRGLTIGVLILALICVAGGLYLQRRFSSSKDDSYYDSYDKR